jgi:hypothetical protein
MLQLMFSRQQILGGLPHHPIAGRPGSEEQRSVLRSRTGTISQRLDSEDWKSIPCPAAAMEALVRKLYDAPTDVVAANKAALAAGSR